MPQGLLSLAPPSPNLCSFSPSNMSSALANAVCQRCQACFSPTERIVHSSGELYHEHCFVCAQCFRPFPEGLFYEVRRLPGPQPAAFLEPQPRPSSVFALQEPVGWAQPGS